MAGMAVRGCRQAGLSGGGGHGRPAHAICGVCGAEPCSPGPREGTAALQRLRVHGVYTCGVDCVCACACARVVWAVDCVHVCVCGTGCVCARVRVVCVRNQASFQAFAQGQVSGTADWCDYGVAERPLPS